MSITSNAPAPIPAHLRLWRYVKGFVIFLVVVFHLLVLATRNPLDLWYNEIRDWMKEHPADAERSYWDRHGEKVKRADTFTWKYTNLTGWEQRWVMFSPPLARKAPFLATRIEFTDGSAELLRSSNEPDPVSYIRVGGWQTRKLEDYLLWPPEDLANAQGRPLWEAFARHKLRQWHESRPGDPRQVRRVVLVRRRLYFPEPGQSHDDVQDPTTEDFVSFDATGRLLP